MGLLFGFFVILCLFGHRRGLFGHRLKTFAREWTKLVEMTAINELANFW